MNNLDLSLDFLKKCQKCRENGVPNDMAILAALQDLADWKDQHQRKGLWDAEKVCKWISERIGIDQKIETNSDGEPLADSYIAYCIARQNAADTIIKELRKAMED